MGNDRPLLSLFRLQRILGLGGAAGEADLARRTRHLIDRLERERADADVDRRDALDREIETLRRSADYWTGVNASGSDGAREDRASSLADRPRTPGGSSVALRPHVFRSTSVAPGAATSRTPMSTRTAGPSADGVCQ